MKSTQNKWAIAIVAGAVCVMTCVLMAVANGTLAPATWAYSLETDEMTPRPPLLPLEVQEYFPYITAFRSPLYYFPYVSRQPSRSSLLNPKTWTRPEYIGKRGPGGWQHR